MTTPISRLLDDSDLIAKAQAGHAEAMHELLSLIRPAVVRFCRGKLASYPGGLDAADDVAQETCVAVFHYLPNYQNRGAPFMAWVYGIAGNKVIDAQRKFRRTNHLPVDDLPEQVEPSPTPEELLITSANVQAAASLIAQLPERMQQVLWMRATGATAIDIGAALGMTASACRVTQHRAMVKLRKMAEDLEDLSA